MKIRLGDLRRLIREAAGSSEEITFNVYGPNDETYVCTATYNPRTPYDIEVWRAVDEAGNEVDVDELKAQGHDLQAAAFDAVAKKYGDDDGIGLDYDDIHGKSGIDY